MDRVSAVVQTTVDIAAGTCENFFTLFVDAIFTTLLKRPFTNTFEVIETKGLRDCLCRARHAD